MENIRKDAEDVLASSAIADNNVLETQSPAPSYLAPDHRLLKEVQDQLYASLTEKSQELDMRIIEQKASLKKARAEREDVGVFLFNHQEKYNNLQRSIKTLDVGVEKVTNELQALTSDLTSLRNQVEENMETFKDKDQQRSDALSKLNETSRTVRVLTTERNQAKDDVSISKRAASKAEQVLKEKEEQKIVQDLLVDSLNMQIDRLEGELKTLERRIDNHKMEETNTRKILGEAINEMDVITMEKRRVLSLWKGALATLEKRDHTLQKLQKQISLMNDSRKTLDQELKGFNKALGDIKFSKEMQESIVISLNEKLAKIDKQIESMNEKRSNLSETHDVLRRSIELSDKEIESFLQEGRLTRAEIERTMKDARRIAGEVQKVELEIMNLYIEKSSISRSNVNKSKDDMVLRRKAQELELDLVQAHNEIARLRLEYIDKERANLELKRILDDYENLISTEKESLDKFENEMHLKHIELTKKQNELETLKKRYDKIVSTLLAQYGQIEGEIGPLEATIHNLTKSIQTKEEESLELQNSWIKTQNELLNCSRRIEDIKENLTSNRTRKTVIERKMTLINQSLQEESEEIRQLKKSCRAVQSQIERINGVMVSNKASINKINDATRESELVFRTRLRDSERECLQLEDKIQSIKRESQIAANNLIESERQLLLWQQKLQMAKESKEAVHEFTSGSEIRELEYELQKAKNLLSTLLKQQERLVQDLTFSVQRQTELNGIKAPSAAARKDTSYQLQYQVTDLRKRLQQLDLGIVECEQQIALSKQKKTELEQVLTELRSQDFYQQEMNLLTALHDRKAKKEDNLKRIVLLQSRSKRYQELKAGKYVFACSEPAQRSKLIQIQEEKKVKLITLKTEMK